MLSHLPVDGVLVVVVVVAGVVDVIIVGLSVGMVVVVSTGCSGMETESNVTCIDMNTKLLRMTGIRTKQTN